MAEADRARTNIAAYWNAISATYDDEPDHRVRGDAEHAAWLALLRDLLPAPPAVVLDVGTGTGFLALLLAELGYAVLGVNLAKQMLAIARAKAAGLARPPTFVAGDAAAPPVARGSMDGIVSRHLLWTLPDPPRALRTWWHVLRPGGWLIIIDGLWSVGTPPDPPSTPPLAERVYPTYYTPEVTARLPLLRTTRLDAILKTITDAGFGEAQVVRVGAIACPTLDDVGADQGPSRALRHHRRAPKRERGHLSHGLIEILVDALEAMLGSGHQLLAELPNRVACGATHDLTHRLMTDAILSRDGTKTKDTRLARDHRPLVRRDACGRGGKHRLLGRHRKHLDPQFGSMIHVL